MAEDQTTFCLICIGRWNYHQEGIHGIAERGGDLVSLHIDLFLSSEENAFVYKEKEDEKRNQ